MHAYEVHPRKDKRGVDLISDVLPFGLWYGEPMIEHEGRPVRKTAASKAARVNRYNLFDPSRRKNRKHGRSTFPTGTR
jgi:hypothetical protein